ncbi:prolipoprotein diacylglyceryl transferase [Anaplasmataceae bacterium AB001_6]|nr:prolipoprotein diacylglyceryl transferase [Anaplasmataceae bacterium AB001_6]
MVIEVPFFNPIAIDFGWVNIRWYAILLLIGGFVCCFKVSKDMKASRDFFEDSIFFSFVYGVLFARLFFIIFYGAKYFMHHPVEIFYIWRGGLSFHGGVFGGAIAVYHMSAKYQITFFRLLDSLVCIVPFAIFLGRIANLINNELIGRESDFILAVSYINEGVARHPSQLYEAFLEGLLLLFIMNVIKNKYRPAKDGVLSYLFFFLYSFFRILCELFRQPDPQVGYILWDKVTMGQVLNLPLVLLGLIMMYIVHFKRSNLCASQKTNKVHL